MQEFIQNNGKMKLILVSELSDEPVDDVHSLGKIGQKLNFRIVSIEPTEHRLGLSLKTADKNAKNAKKDKDEAEKEAEE